MPGWSARRMTAASESPLSPARPARSEVDWPSANDGLRTTRAFGGRRSAASTRSASWPRTTITSPQPPPAAAFTACWTRGLPPRVASCLVEPNRVARPAARTMPEITRPAGQGRSPRPNRRLKNRTMARQNAHRPSRIPFTGPAVARGAGAGRGAAVGAAPDPSAAPPGSAAVPAEASAPAAAWAVRSSSSDVMFVFRHSANCLVSFEETSCIIPRENWATAPVTVMSWENFTLVSPSAAASAHAVTRAVAEPLPRCSMPLAFSTTLWPASSRSCTCTVPANDSDTGPSFTVSLPLKWVSSTTSVSCAPGMHGAIFSTSRMYSHTRSSGAGTVKSFSISMPMCSASRRPVLFGPVVDGSRAVPEEAGLPRAPDGQDLRHDRGCDLLRPLAPEIDPGRPVDLRQVLVAGHHPVAAELVQEPVRPDLRPEHPDVRHVGPQERPQVLPVPQVVVAHDYNGGPLVGPRRLRGILRPFDVHEPRRSRIPLFGQEHGALVHDEGPPPQRGRRGNDRDGVVSGPADQEARRRLENLHERPGLPLGPRQPANLRSAGLQKLQGSRGSVGVQRIVSGPRFRGPVGPNQ